MPARPRPAAADQPTTGPALGRLISSLADHPGTGPHHADSVAPTTPPRCARGSGADRVQVWRRAREHAAPPVRFNPAKTGPWPQAHRLGWCAWPTCAAVTV